MREKTKSIIALVVMLAAITLLCIYKAKAEDTTYRLKVVVSNHAIGHVEAKFTTMPEDLRMVCEGDTTGVLTGEYVRIDFDMKHGYTIHGTKMTCKNFVWVK